jgi:DNA invertase Pin-like site-specific DNA recombinase
MSKVFSYIRFSSAKQSAGDSYARQVRAAKAFCDEHSLEMADPRDYLFFDSGRSAYKGKHLDDTGELARFLSYVEDGTIPAGSYLVVESLDRLSREKVKEALPRFLDLLAKGINVYTSTDRRLYTKDYDVTDLIISIISMARAYEESAVKGHESHQHGETNRRTPALLASLSASSAHYGWTLRPMATCSILTRQV